MLYWLVVNQGYAICHKEILKRNRADLTSLSIRNQYQSAQEEHPGSLAAAVAEALMCASCIRLNDAYSFVFVSKLSSKVGLPFFFCETVC